MTINVTAADEPEQAPEEGKKEVVNPQDIDPESMMIVEAFDPVLVTCHNDSFIRFWTPEVRLVHVLDV